jgi:hypothetical protein
VLGGEIIEKENCIAFIRIFRVHSFNCISSSK